MQCIVKYNRMCYCVLRTHTHTQEGWFIFYTDSGHIVVDTFNMWWYACSSYICIFRNSEAQQIISIRSKQCPYAYTLWGQPTPSRITIRHTTIHMHAYSIFIYVAVALFSIISLTLCVILFKIILEMCVESLTNPEKSKFIQPNTQESRT